MKLLLKHREEIASLGLVPVIGTLVFMHFFPVLPVLGSGLLACIAGLLYALMKWKVLNFFFIQGTIALALCFIIRFFTNHALLPEGTVTLTIELLLLIFAFIQLTVPEYSQQIQKKLHLKNYLSYRIETKIIVILSSFHLILMAITCGISDSLSPMAAYTMRHVAPLSIYLFCLLVNIIGIRIALTHYFVHKIVRIAPICNGKVYLVNKAHASYFIPDNKRSSWDLPLESCFQGSLKKGKKFAQKMLSTYVCRPLHIEPRLILKHPVPSTFDCKHLVAVYIYPLAKEDEFHTENGRYFSFDEIKAQKDAFSDALMWELERLQMAAEVWKEYDIQ